MPIPFIDTTSETFTPPGSRFNEGFEIPIAKPSTTTVEYVVCQTSPVEALTYTVYSMFAGVSAVVRNVTVAKALPPLANWTLEGLTVDVAPVGLTDVVKLTVP